MTDGPWVDLVKGAGLDRYDRNARLKPALLALLPLFLLIAFWTPQARTFVGAVASFLGACGLTYFMAQFARRRGRAVEREAGDAIGRAHSARLLTWADPVFAPETKRRYHDHLAANGLRLSGTDEERDDPALALRRARSAIDWLLVATRPASESSLLFKENVAYGFSRNLFGLKPHAIAIVVVVMLADGVLMVTHPTDRNALLGGAAIATTSVLAFFAWVRLVALDGVCDASLAYAQQLFSLCEAGARHRDLGGGRSTPGERPRT